MTRAIWIDFLKEKQEEQEKFINEVYKIAFGNSAKCDFSLHGFATAKEDVLKRLRELIKENKK
mgnify:CR=1 FL=1